MLAQPHKKGLNLVQTERMVAESGIAPISRLTARVNVTPYHFCAVNYFTSIVIFVNPPNCQIWAIISRELVVCFAVHTGEPIGLDRC